MLRYGSSALLSVLLLAGSSSALAADSGPVKIQIMTHLCNTNIKNVQDFQALEAGRSPVAALANTVLNCPTTGLPGNAAVANTVASPRSTYDFQVLGKNGNTQTLAANGMFMSHKLCESDLNLDVNGDGTISSSTCLDISHYEVSNVMTDSGRVRVVENMPPSGFHFGTLRFTPPALDGNNDASSLRDTDPATGTILLDATNDTDKTIMLHVYNFVDASSTGSTTGSTLPGGIIGSAGIQALINHLREIVASLQAEIQSLQNMLGTSDKDGTGTSTMTGMISPAHATVRTGSSVDFSGRDFGHEETVTVMTNGMTVTTAHADGGGNFSTGSVTVPSTPGMYTYTFTGVTSGMVGTAMLTVTP